MSRTIIIPVIIIAKVSNYGRKFRKIARHHSPFAAGHHLGGVKGENAQIPQRADLTTSKFRPD